MSRISWKRFCIWGHDTQVCGRYANGHCTLCGKVRAEKWRIRKPVLYRNILASAKKRGFIVTLTYEDFLKINLLPCHYCGGPLPTTGYGVDRKNNEPYYSIENSLPCCERCNETKSNKLTYEEFRLVLDYRKNPNKYKIDQKENNHELHS